VENGTESSFDKGDVTSFNTLSQQFEDNGNPNKLSSYNNKEMGLTVTY